MAAVQDILVHTSCVCVCVRVRTHVCVRRGGESCCAQSNEGRGGRRICVIFCSQADRGRNVIYFIKKLFCKKEN
jgi:hypothetical protein